ncbi:hypothetical protein B0H14DRAFT_2655879 [Mycena olivaceomarginata]|nr:hypothetical protein B0H14DRAFT_2655879 [Mycena olivaceomarginata]
MALGESAAGFCAEGEGLYKSESSEGVPGGRANRIKPSERALVLSIRRQRAKSGQRGRNRNNKRRATECSFGKLCFIDVACGYNLHVINIRVIAMEGSSSKGAAHQTRLCADQGAEDASWQHNMRRPTCTSSIFVKRAMYSEAGSNPRRAGAASVGQRRKASEGGKWAAGSRKRRAVTTSVEQQRREADSVRRTEGGLGSSEPVTAERAGRLLKGTSKRRARAAAAACRGAAAGVEPVNGRCGPEGEPGWCIDQSKEQRPGGRANGSKQKGCWWSTAAKRIRK